MCIQLYNGYIFVICLETMPPDKISSEDDKKRALAEWTTVRQKRTKVKTKHIEQRAVPSTSSEGYVDSPNHLRPSLAVAAKLGFERECLLEALILEALCCLDTHQSIYKYTDEDTSKQDDLDMMHLKLASTSGDAATVVKVMRSWIQSLKRGCAGKWCDENGISIKVLQEIEAVVEESYSILPTLAPRLKFQPLKFNSDLPAVDKLLVDVAINAFTDDVCVYSGHKAMGYFHVKREQFLNIHVSSSFNFMADLPKFIINVGQSKDACIHHPLAISEQQGMDLMSQMFYGGSKDFIESITVHPISFPIQRTTLCLLQDLSSDEHVQLVELISKHTNDDISYIDCQNKTKNLVIYTLPKYHMSLQDLVQKYLSDLQEITDRMVINFPFGNSKSIKLLVSAGMATKYPIILNHYTSLKVIKCNKDTQIMSSQLKTDIVDEDVKDVKITRHDDAENVHSWGQLDFKIPTDAVLAFERQSSDTYFLEPVKSTKITSNGELHRSHVLVSQMIEVMISLCHKTEHIFSLRNFYQMIVDRLRDVYNDCIQVTVMPHSTETGTTVYDANILCNGFTCASKVMLFMKSWRMKNADIIITNPEDVQYQLCSFTISMDNRLYDVVKDTFWKRLKNFTKTSGVTYSMYCDNEKQFKIDIHCHDDMTSQRIRNKMTSIVQHLKVSLQHTDENVYKYFLSKDSDFWLSEMSRETNTLIVRSPDMKKLWIYGLAHTVKATSKHLDTLLSNITEFAKWYSMDISLEDAQTIHRKHLNVVQMCSTWNVADCKIMPRQGLLYFKIIHPQDGVNARKQILCDILTASECICKNNNTNVDCCVCFAEIEVSDTYTLERCGHTFCFDCLKNQFTTLLYHNAIFPVTCADCDIPFSVHDILAICGPLKICNANKLLQASLRCFLAANADKYRSCPHLSCMGVIKLGRNREKNLKTKKSKSGSRIQCNFCHSLICNTCLSTAHEGMTCEKYAEVIGCLKKWIQERPDKRKQCPVCNIGIEKVDGCNNVTCFSCKSSICWVCLDWFKSGHACYEHLDKVHNGYWQDRHGQGIDYDPGEDNMDEDQDE